VPLVTVLNLSQEDDLAAIEQEIARSLSSMPELAVNDSEIDVIPVRRPDGFENDIVRINVDLWERPERGKQALQELAMRVAEGFLAVLGRRGTSRS